MLNLTDKKLKEENEIAENFTSTSTQNTTSSTSSSTPKKKICNRDMILNIIIVTLILYVLYLLLKDNGSSKNMGLHGLNERITTMYPCDMY